ncbi:hypothetical protein BJ138DRAFT_1156606 [Hygrophoropsis aurantiaca]|uniref:Uncharacterized protein n=1 Tax=Hygrophoropsis aurantiaca TaxID=72124 RepID=A0ACB8A5Y5_9AGAM|nr:hypothetical protein BJ138DRAFT_1156606 [Hygrophoropsis aurantiaca]
MALRHIFSIPTLHWAWSIMSDLAVPSIEPVVIDLGSTYGVTLAGVCIAYILYGILCLQIFLYFIRCKSDSIALKMMVVAWWMLDTAHELLSTVGVWQFLVSNFGNATFIAALHVPLPLSTIFLGLISASVQAFMVWRIWRCTYDNDLICLSLSDTLQLAAIIGYSPPSWPQGLLSSQVLCIVWIIRILDVRNLDSLGETENFIIAYDAIAAVVDIATSIILCALLATNRSDDFSKKTDAIITRLIILSINTGLWTSLFALMSVIMIKATPGTLIFCIWQIPLSPLYCNTAVGCLNAREFIRQPSFESSMNSSPVPLDRLVAASTGGPLRSPDAASVTGEMAKFDA